MFAMLAGGKLFGFWGLILGSPCAGILKIFMTKLYPTLFEEIPSSATTTEEKEAKEQETKDKKAEDEKQETKDKEAREEETPRKKKSKKNKK